MGGARRYAVLGFSLLGAAVVGAFLYDRLRPPVAGTGAPSVAAATAAAASIRIPDMRPAFALKDPEGRVHSASEWDGKDLMVNFWATWCAPCRREIPLLNRIRKEYAPRGVEIVGIAVDFVDDVIAYRKKFPIDYPVLVGEQDGIDAARDFGVAAPVFPFTVFTDAKGRVLTVHVGELHEAEARAILAVVARVDAGTLAPPDAREAIRSALASLPKAAHAPPG
jgi:thiol-disulfide isomerase/thioredoxin